MEPTVRSRSTNLAAAALGIWVSLGTAAAIWADPGSLVLSLALLVFTLVVALTDLFRFAGWLAGAAAVLVYGGAQVALAGFTPSIILPVAVNGTLLLGTALLGSILAQQTGALTRQLEHDRRLIGELRLHDPATGLVRFQYARQTLKVEITRSQRYGTDLSLLVIELGNRQQIEEERGLSGMEETRRELGSLLLSLTRQVDTSFVNGTLGSILPHTNPDGASIVAERLVANAARRLKLDLRVGIAHFPKDAVSEEDLIRDAEMALQVALTSGRPVVLYHQVREAVDTALPVTER
jgi:GGDEF domain-containing protein